MARDEKNLAYLDEVLGNFDYGDSHSTKGPVIVDGIEFDTLIDITEQYQTTVPALATEAGYEVSDDVLPTLPSMTMTLFVTSTPVTWRFRPGHMGRHPREVINLLYSKIAERTILTVITPKKTYTNQMIRKMTVHKSEEYENAVEITLTFSQMLFAPKAAGSNVPNNRFDMVSGEMTSQILEVGDDDRNVFTLGEREIPFSDIHSWKDLVDLYNQGKEKRGNGGR